MKIRVVDTFSMYKEMMELPIEERLTFLEKDLLASFRSLYQTLNLPIREILKSLLAVDAESAVYTEMIEILKEKRILEKSVSRLKSAAILFEEAGIVLPEELIFGIYLGNAEHLRSSMGYTGFGGIPGYIQMVIAPNDYNLKRFEAAVAHELHHNAMFSLQPFDPWTVALKDYILYEGLAECFGAEQCGEELVGPWVTHLGEDDVKLSKALIKDHLEDRGLQATIPFVFGDQLVTDQLGKKVIMPRTGGYVCGYQIVKAYLKNTGKNVIAAMQVTSDEIIKKSKYFA